MQPVFPDYLSVSYDYGENKGFIHLQADVKNKTFLWESFTSKFSLQKLIISYRLNLHEWVLGRLLYLLFFQMLIN